MTDFTEAQLPEAGQVETQTPNRGPSSALAAGASAARGVANFASIFAQKKGNEAALQRETASATLKTEYATQLNKIADAVQTGQITSSAGQLKTRSLFNAFAAANPQYLDDIVAIQKDHLGTTGMGKVIAEGSQQEQQDRKDMATATTQGFVSSYASPEDQQAQLAAWRVRNKQAKDLELSSAALRHTSAQLEVAIKKGSLNKASLEADLAQQKQEARANLVSFGVQNNKVIANSYQNIFDDPTLSEGEKVEQIENNFRLYSAEIRQAGHGAPTNEIDNQLAYAQLYKDNYIQALSGRGETLDNEAMQRRIDNLRLNELNRLASTTSGARILAMSEFGQDIALVFAPEIARMGLDMWAEVQGDGSSLPDVLGSEDSERGQASSGLFNWITEAIGAADTPEKEAELNNVVNNTLGAVGQYGLSNTDPKNFKQFVEATADPRVADFYVDNQNIEQANNAKQALFGSWKSGVAPMIKNEVPAGYTFLVDNQGQVQFTGEDLRVVRRLNNEVAPIMNQWNRAFAHLSGTKDYAASFVENGVADSLRSIMPPETAPEQRGDVALISRAIDAVASVPFNAQLEAEFENETGTTAFSNPEAFEQWKASQFPQPANTTENGIELSAEASEFFGD